MQPSRPGARQPKTNPRRHKFNPPNIHTDPLIHKLSKRLNRTVVSKKTKKQHHNQQSQSYLHHHHHQQPQPQRKNGVHRLPPTISTIPIQIMQHMDLVHPYHWEMQVRVDNFLQLFIISTNNYVWNEMKVHVYVLIYLPKSNS